MEILLLIAFRALLDNYEADTKWPEKVTAREERENWHFLDVVMDTEVMRTAHEFLVFHDKAPADINEFKQLLHDIWFKLYTRRRGDRLSVQIVFVQMWSFMVLQWHNYNFWPPRQTFASGPSPPLNL